MSFFKAQVSLPSNFASIFSVSSITFLYFFQLKHYILLSKEPIKEQIFQIFECSSHNLSIFKSQISSSSNFASFFIVTRHNSSTNFKLIDFLFWTKGSHQSPNYETFKCSGENLPNFSCHFSNHKSVFLQILHHSLVS